MVFISDFMCPACKNEFSHLRDCEVNKANISFDEFFNEIKEDSFLKENKERLLFIYKSLLNKGRSKIEVELFNMNCDFCDYICKFKC